MKLYQNFLVLGLILLSNFSFSQQKQQFNLLDERSLESAFKQNIQSKNESYFQLYHLVTLDCSNYSDANFTKLIEKISINNAFSNLNSIQKNKEISFTVKMSEITLTEESVWKMIYNNNNFQPIKKINIQNIQIK